MFLAPHVLVNAGLILSVPRRTLSSSEPEKKEKVPAGLSSVACRLSDRGFRQLIQSFRRAQKSGWLPVGIAGCFRSESVDDLPGIRRYAGGCKSDLFLELYSFSTTEDRNRSRSSYKRHSGYVRKVCRSEDSGPACRRRLGHSHNGSASAAVALGGWGVRQRLSVSSLQRLEANLGIEPEQSRPKTGAHQ